MQPSVSAAPDPEDGGLGDQFLDHDFVNDGNQEPRQFEPVSLSASEIEYLDFERIAKDGIPPIAWIIFGWLAACEIALVGGPAGIGKSTLIAALAVAIATGKPWCGIVPNRTGKVLVLDEEQSKDEVARLYLRSGAQGVANLRVASLQGVNMATDKGARLIAAEIKREQPIAVILDSATQVFVGIDENSAMDVAPVFRRLSHLAEKFGVTFIIVHHVRKPSADRKNEGLNLIRGSTVWGTQSSTVWAAAAAGEDAIDLIQVKRRGADKQRLRIHYSAEEGEQGAIKLTGEPLVNDSKPAPSGEQVYATVLRVLRERGHAKRGEIVAVLIKDGMSATAADQAVGRALKAGMKKVEIERTGKGTYRIVDPDIDVPEEEPEEEEQEHEAEDGEP